MSPLFSPQIVRNPLQLNFDVIGTIIASHPFRVLFNLGLQFHAVKNGKIYAWKPFHGSIPIIANSFAIITPPSLEQNKLWLQVWNLYGQARVCLYDMLA